MASTASAGSIPTGPAAGGNGTGVGGGMDELLPLVLQLTNAESVSTMLSVCPFVVPLRFESHSGALKLCIDAGIGTSNDASFISRFDNIFLIVS